MVPEHVRAGMPDMEYRARSVGIFRVRFAVIGYSYAIMGTKTKTERQFERTGSWCPGPVIHLTIAYSIPVV